MEGPCYSHCAHLITNAWVDNIAGPYVKVNCNTGQHYFIHQNITAVKQKPKSEIPVVNYSFISLIVYLSVFVNHLTVT